MKYLKLSIMIIFSIAICSCNFSLKRTASLDRCAKIYESLQRAECYNKTKDFNKTLTERIDREKRENKAKEKLDFKPKKEKQIMKLE